MKNRISVIALFSDSTCLAAGNLPTSNFEILIKIRKYFCYFQLSSQNDRVQILVFKEFPHPHTLTFPTLEHCIRNSAVFTETNKHRFHINLIMSSKNWLPIEQPVTAHRYTLLFPVTFFVAFRHSRAAYLHHAARQITPPPGKPVKLDPSEKGEPFRRGPFVHAMTHRPRRTIECPSLQTF